MTEGRTGSVDHQQDRGGMSLRDYFAAKAMAAYIVSSTTSRDDTERCSFWAYEQADSMMKERSKDVES